MNVSAQNIARVCLQAAIRLFDYMVDLMLFQFVVLAAVVAGIFPQVIAALVFSMIKGLFLASASLFAVFLAILGWKKYGTEIVRKLRILFGMDLRKATFEDYRNTVSENHALLGRI